MPPKATKSLSNGSTILTILPPEVLSIIGEQADWRDWLPLKLSCKAFATNMRGTLQAHIERNSSKAWEQSKQVVRGRVSHALCRNERKHRQRRKMKYLTCTSCHHVKQRKALADSQVPGKLEIEMLPNDYEMVHERVCLTCGADAKSFFYNTRKSIKVTGKQCFICWRCDKVFLLDSAWATATSEKHGDRGDPPFDILLPGEHSKVCVGCDKAC